LHNTSNLLGTGSVTFYLYAPGATCHNDGSGSPVYMHVASSTVSDNGPFASGTFPGPVVAGTYQWVAVFSGDGNNNSASSGCGNEPVVITASPTITTTQTPATGSVGDLLNDSATLSGGSNFDGMGTITFNLYGPNDPTCDGQPAYTETVTADHNGNDYVTSNSTVTANTAGTWNWTAHFSGDSNNNPADSGCGDEPVVINPAHIQIVKTADHAQVNAGEDIGFTLTVYNDGTGNAKGVTLTDTLPVKAGVSWSIDDTGAGWGDPTSCAISSGVLTCGPATVPAGTTLAASTFTVHITSHTTTDTGGVCPEGSGVIENTGDVTTTNDGSAEGSASACVAAPEIHIVKTADAAQVNVGSPIGFTMTAYNTGSGDAKGVTLSDTLPTNAGLSWSIAAQGAGWNGSCTIAAGKLTCGPVTVPAGTTQAASTFTVHITSGTTGATGGDCPTTGVVTNTGDVTTTNDGSDTSTATTCVQALVDLTITKTGSPATQTLGDGNITWTMVVTNNGPSDDTGVKITDPMPAGNTFVSASASPQGTCTGGAILTCNLGTMAAGAKITITLVTTPSTVGAQTNTVAVVGDRPETNTANNTATATVQTVGIIKPPVFCVAVSSVTPKQLFVGRKTTLTIHLTQNKKAVQGIHVRIKGPKLNIKTEASNAKGVVKQTVKMKKAGVLVFTPIASKACNTKRVGITNVFTPPVTG
jgi:uncharacterized repeat protein (TIGR01451 family)